MLIKVNDKEFNVVGHAEVRRIITSLARKAGIGSFVLVKNGNIIEPNRLELKDGDEFIIMECE